jgi:hypothetical protein
MRRSLPRLLLSIAALLPAACAPEGPSAFVTGALVPDSECVTTNEPGGNAFKPIGSYDISPGFNGDTDNCNAPYIVHLFVNSFLRPNADPGLGRAEPNVLQLHSAEVRLMDINHATIAFDREEPALPNPFVVTVSDTLLPTDGTNPETGLAHVEVIPTAYAPELDRFAQEQQQILAEIQIFGTTTGDVDVDLKPFVYTIQLCDGCMTLCRSMLEDEISDEEIYGEDVCIDNASADGRVCVDEGGRCALPR